MPGNVQNAVPSGVFPQTLSLAFAEAREYPELQNGYHDQNVQRSQLATASRKTFRLTKRLTPTALATLKTFWDAHVGGIAFLFYNPFEPASGQPIGSNYDAGGSSTQGRYTCVFRGSWTQQAGMARTQTGQIEFVEVA